MLHREKFPWLVPLAKKDVFFATIGRLLLLGCIIIPAIARKTTLVDNSFAFALVAVFATSMLCIGFYLTNRSLHRLFSYLLPSIHGFKKDIAYVCLIPLPILEIIFVFKHRTKEKLYVPAFFQPNENGRLSLYHSFILFETGIAKPNIAEIADYIRDTHKNTSVANNTISIQINHCNFQCLFPKSTEILIIADSPFKHTETLDPLDLNDSKYLASTILDAIDRGIKSAEKE